MSRGGFRPGAGRPKGAKAGQSKNRDGFSADVVRAASKADMSPLDYMLTVMRNPDADQSRRDRMAIAAAPFCHPRVADNKLGKKDSQAEEAKSAGHNSEWSGDLEFDGTRPH
jgi:hypothetical protein